MKDRVYTTTAGTGTGDLTLDASPTGYVSPATAFTVGDSGIPFCILDKTTGDFEIVECTLVSGPALQRDTVLDSSNGGAAVSFAAGAKQVFHDLPAAYINDLLANRITTASVITGGITPAADHLAVEVAGSLKRITVENFIAGISSTTLDLPAAGGLSGSDLVAITQSGATEVKTTLLAIANYVKDFINGTVTYLPSVANSQQVNAASGSAIAVTGGPLYATIANSQQVNTASGAAISVPAAGYSATIANSQQVNTAAAAAISIGTTYTITGYSGTAVNTASDATSWAVYSPLTGRQNDTGATGVFTTNAYWNISPVPASAKAGWGTSNSTAPAEITQSQNQSSGSSINGMIPMTKPGAFYNQAYLWVTDGSGTSGPYYYWIKPVDGPAQCMNAGAGLTVNNA